MSTYKFGVAALTGDKANWLVQSASVNSQAQEALALNNEGEPVVAHYYQKIAERTLEVIIPDSVSESDVPEVGDVFEYDGVKYYVSASTITETNTDFRKYSITCKHFKETNLPQ